MLVHAGGGTPTTEIAIQEKSAMNIRAYAIILAALVLPPTLTMAAPAVDVSHPGIFADTFIGAQEAPVTLIVYSSPTCPHCIDFHEENLPALKNLADSGKLKIVYRPFVRNSLDAVIFMLAKADAPLGFDETVSRFMSRIDEIAAAGDTEAAVRRVAASLGIDKATFDRAVSDQDYLDQLGASTAEAVNKFGVTGTPTFFVNGKAVVPRSSFDEIQDAVMDAATQVAP